MRRPGGGSMVAVRVALGAVIALLGVTGISASASAYTGPAAPFNYCAVNNPEVFKCLYVNIYGGEVILGKKTVPIINPLVLQGGYTENEKALDISKRRWSQMVPATNGVSLSKTPEPVPGGLLGLIPPSSSPPSIRQLTTYYTDHDLDAVYGTVELAEPANDAIISEYDLLSEEELATQLLVKIHLENPFLGSSCYIGSNSSPIVWNLTTGATEATWEHGFNFEEEQRLVPAPNKSIVGTSGVSHEIRVIVGGVAASFSAALTGAQLVANAWAAPGATGCGGTLAPIIDPLVNAATGLPSPAGRNTVKNDVNIDIATPESVREFG